jgi:MFS family permease
MVIGRIGSRIATRRAFGLSAVVFGCFDLLLFYYPLFVSGIVLAIVLMILAGLPTAAMGIGQQTLLQTAVADAYRGRLFGALNTTGALSRLLGAVIAGVLGDRLGIIPILTMQGVGYILGGVMVLFMLSSRRVKAANRDLSQTEN